MLITQTKVINLHGQPVKVFSIDGKLWVSKPSDLKEFKSAQHQKAICQKCVAERTMFLFPVSSLTRITRRARKQMKDKIKEKWGDLTDDEIDVAAGERDQLAGKIQQKYGVGKEEAERQVDEWAKDLQER